MYTRLVAFISNKFNVDARYFLSGGFWLGLGQLATILSGLATTVLFAHFLSENEYGTYKYLIGITTILSSLSLTGLGQSVLQTAAKGFFGFYQKTLRVNFTYSLGITISAIIGVGYYWLNENNILATGCLAIAIFQPLTNTFQLAPSFLLGSQRFKENTILHTTRMLFISSTSIISLLLTKDIIVLFTAYLVSYLIANLVSYLYVKPPSLKVPKEIVSRYLKYAKHTSLRNIIGNISQKLDTVVIFTQLGAVELAIYSIAIIIPEQIKASFKGLSFLLLPKYANHTNLDKLKKSVPRRSFQLFSLLVLISIIYIIAAPYLYGLIFPKYPEAILYSQLLSLTFPTFVLYIPYSILQAQLQEKALYRLSVYSSLFQIIFVILGVLNFGLTGAILAKVGYRTLYALMSYISLNKIK